MDLKKIDREELAHLHFSTNDVLTNSQDRIQRERKLRDAMVLGNLEHQKCKILVHSTECDAEIETTIWAVTDKYICLKGGLALLVASIIDVIL